jgi:hypothetical protein
MPATRYKLWAIGDGAGDGTNPPIHVGVAGIAKCSTEELPYTVANELICSNLARILYYSYPYRRVLL